MFWFELIVLVKLFHILQYFPIFPHFHSHFRFIFNTYIFSINCPFVELQYLHCGSGFFVLKNRSQFVSVTDDFKIVYEVWFSFLPDGSLFYFQPHCNMFLHSHSTHRPIILLELSLKSPEKSTEIWMEITKCQNRARGVVLNGYILDTYAIRFEPRFFQH